MAAPQILHVFSTFAVGGPQVRFAKLAAHLGDRYRHAIVAMDGDYACRERLDPRLDIAYPPVAFAKGRTVANVLAFRRFIRALHPALMVTSNWGTIEWSMANALPLARHIHIEDGFGPEERGSQLPRRVWTRRALLRRGTVVVPSRVLQRIATETWALPERRVAYIPNGIDCTGFVPRAQPGDGRKLVIGTVAALRPEKNLARLLWAFRRIAAPARLVIVGDGPQRKRLQMLAGDLGLADRVDFPGHVETPQAAYAGFDIFALSSDTEQMPLSVIEAMAAGLPVAATDVGDVAEMVADGNRPFVAGRDQDALAASLQVLACAPELRRKIGAANRDKAVRLYDEGAMLRAYSLLFEAAAGNG